MTEPAALDDLWRDAVRAAQVLALSPTRLGGVCLRAPAGPVRDALLHHIRAGLGPDIKERRLPVSVTEDALNGGLDLAASLEAGRVIQSKGILDADANAALLLVMPMAERIDQRVAGLIVRALEAPRRAPLACIALDEGREDDERPPAALCEHLAITIDLSALARVPEGAVPVPTNLADARARLESVAVPDSACEALCLGSAALGIASLRAPLFAVAVAKASAALAGRDAVDDDDVAFAARFVLGPRATAVPMPDAGEPEADDAEPDPPQQDSKSDEASQDQREQPKDTIAPEDVVIAAAKTTLPSGLLTSGVTAQRQQARRQGKSGAAHKARRRGRPLASRPGRIADGGLDLLATLKAAVPWQKLRRPAQGGKRLSIRRGDIHVRRYRERSESLTIFVVDASGSTAAQRLSEAKGAVELLLADCYVRRDQVALISFRKTEASLLLPPTRSLVRAKRLLADMPAGGGTPFASAITTASDLADSAQRAGLTPLMVFLTDGGANITREGKADRAQAEAEARAAAKRAGALGHRALLLDVAQRDRPLTREIAGLLRARHISLPRADAASLARAVDSGSRSSRSHA